MYLAPLFGIAYVTDLLLGDPETWPHPVRWIGKINQFWETRLYTNNLIAGIRHWVLVIFCVCLALYLFKQTIAQYTGFEILGTVWLIYSALATRSLHTACAEVETCLRTTRDLTPARKKLSRIVGRETDRLDEQGIRRAVLETMAENLSDGVIAPIFYLTLGGPGLMILYKAVNTLDSMIGYKNEKYLLFGRFAARVDDVANFIPARLSGLLLILAAALTGGDWKQAWAIMLRDRHNAASPNAGVPEAAFAGALGIRLGGPSTYFGRVIDKPFIGDPGHELTTGDHTHARSLLYGSSLAAAGLSLISLILTHAGWWGLLGVMCS